MTGGRAGACALWHRREPENGEAQGQEGAGRSWARRRAPCPTASCAAAAAHVALPHGHAAPDGPPAVQCSGGGVPMSTRAARPLLGTTGDSRLGARLPSAHSRPVRPVRWAPSAPATRRLPGWMKRIGTTHRPPAPSRRSTRALRGGRAARARGSVRTWECDSERGNRPLLTRSTRRRLAIVWSSPHAAGPGRRGFVRRSGTALLGPCPTGV